MKGDRERCLEAGMDAYVAKPIQADDLFAVIERMAPPPAEPPNGPAHNGAVDWDKALVSVGGDHDILRALVEVFLDTCPQWMDDLLRAVQRQDAVAVRRLAHSIKGTMGQFGVHGACEAAGHLESMGERRDFSGAQDAYAALHRELQALEPVFESFAHATSGA
jgi:CheY-like chemotaxis protein